MRAARRRQRGFCMFCIRTALWRSFKWDLARRRWCGMFVIWMVDRLELHGWSAWLLVSYGRYYVVLTGVGYGFCRRLAGWRFWSCRAITLVWNGYDHFT